MKHGCLVTWFTTPYSPIVCGIYVIFKRPFLTSYFYFVYLGKKKMVYNGWILRKLHRGQEKSKEKKEKKEKSKVLWGKERIMERSGLSAQNLLDKWMILQTLWNIKYIKGQ